MLYLIYIIEWSCCLLVLWGAYRVFVRPTTLHRVNRIALLSILLGAPLLPLCRLETDRFVPQELRPDVNVQEELQERLSAPAVTVILGAPTPEEQAEAPAPQRSFSLVSIALFLYLCLAGGLVLWYAVSLGRLLHFLRYHCQRKKIRHIRLAFCEEAINPFSFGRTICLSRHENSQSLHFAFLHEAGHLSLCHALDLLLLHLLSMVNPMVLLLLNDLKRVHEFEADEFVERRSPSSKPYQYFLLHKSTGVDAYALVHNFNTHFIKQRIIMMNRKRTKRIGLIRLAFFLPALCFLVASHALTHPQSAQSDAPNTDVSARTARKFSLKGTWYMSRVASKSEPDKIHRFGTDYTRIKVYKENGDYYCAEAFGVGHPLNSKDGTIKIYPHETGTYSLSRNGKHYTECGRKTPFQIIGKDEMTTEWNGTIEYWTRITDETPNIPKNPQGNTHNFQTEQIRDLIQKYKLFEELL